MYAQEDTRPIASFAALPSIGQDVPSFAFPSLNGDEISSQSLRGRPAVLVMWATWCGASRRILDDVEKMSKLYEAKPISVIVLADDDAATLRSFVQSRNLISRFAVAGSGLQAAFDRSSTAPERDRMRVEWALPLWLVIDAGGKVAYRNGGPNAAKIVAVADSLLAAK
jgi:thiol-disulfide isomerase/thioredoxin